MNKETKLVTIKLSKQENGVEVGQFEKSSSTTVLSFL